MFRKKKSAPSTIQSRQSLTQTPSATPSASSAAALAFLKKQASDVNLSSAAAAAALRSHTTSPTAVGDVQTKRMVRRGSISTNGSPAGSLRQPLSSGVQRRGSSGSMTERTFRSPSPAARPSVPPVPSIPYDVPPVPARSAARMTSPTPSTPPVKPSPAPIKTSGPPRTTTGQQPASPQGTRSINFSRPMSPPLEPRQLAVQPKARPSSSLGFASTTGNRPPQQTQTSPKQAGSNRMGVATQGSPGATRGSPTKSTVPSGPPAALTAATLAARPTSQQGSHAPSNTRSVAPRQVTASPTPPAASMRTQTPTKVTPAVASTSPVTNTKRAPPRTDAAQASAIEQQRAKQAHDAQMKASAMHARPLSNVAPVATIPAPAPAVTAAKSAGLSQPSTAAATNKPAPQTVPAERKVAPTSPTLSKIQPSTPAEVKRTTSVSPNRSAHFSDTPLLDAVKHQPPPRAVSPGKSALKMPSPRETSPADPAQPAPSEASDAKSNASDDGAPTSSKKKKPTRVSFEETPVLVGHSAAPSTPENTILSPQYSKFPVGTLPSDDSDSMTPRPVLPSFGSIRSRKDEENEPIASTATAMSRSAEPTSALKAASSTDDNLANIVARDVAERTHRETAEMNKSLTPSSAVTEVPAIAVNPPTPRADEEQAEFPYSTQHSLQVDKDIPDHVSEDSVDVYSDAAEDLSDLEEVDETGDSRGFASLDAILESPTTESTPAMEPLSNSPLARSDSPSPAGVATYTMDENSQADDWDTVRAYWNSLTDQKKKELEAEASPSPATPTELSQPNGQSDSKAISTDNDENLPPWPDQQFQNIVTSGKPAAIQNPMVGQDTTATKLSKGASTMRASSGGFSDAEADDERPAKSTARPAPKTTSSIPTGQAPSGVAVKKNVLQKQTKPPLGRTLSSDSSDSDSSFRKRRAARNAKSDGGMLMRRTMRGTDATTPSSKQTTAAGAAATMRSSMHSPSPSESATRKPLRSSMRTSTDSAAPSLRASGAEDSKRSSILGGFRRSSKTRATADKSGSGFRSRFGDSSDEDDGPQMFRSRFAADSDDDDDAGSRLASPAKLAPVIGIPRRKDQQDGDSSDLPDSDDEQTAATRVNKSSGLNAVNGTSPAMPSDGGDQKSKRGMFGFHRRKASKDGSVVNSPVSVQGSAVPGSPVATSPTTTKPAESMPRTMRSSSIGASSNRRSFIQRLSGSRPTTPQPEPSSNDFPYPPPPIPNEYLQESLGNRPNTSDGPNSAQATRPPLGSKRQSTMTAPPGSVKGDKPIVVSSRTGKKKRFQGLRRVFGLND